MPGVSVNERKIFQLRSNLSTEGIRLELEIGVAAFGKGEDDLNNCCELPLSAATAKYEQVTIP
jgi:hypothetical protein